MQRNRSVALVSQPATESWNLALVGGAPHDVFVVREALRSLGVPFELTHYADTEQARAFGVELAKSREVTLPNWPRPSQSVPMLFSVSGPVPEGLVPPGAGTREELGRTQKERKRE
jgi:hypothetical protein